ncbi:MAG TPA: histidine kinase dimerization/phospho-acceptor domain-containing protein [Polyangiaceae bacterium]|nr:histidine kinase dimerization/phospho-acceptor domain-containing protein [Polyangiaceae bacterium]
MLPTDEEQQVLNVPFSDYIAERNLRNARLLALLTATLVPSGVVLDWFTHREQIGTLFLLRLAASVVAFFFYYLTFRPWAIRHTFVLGAAPILAAAGSLELMIENLEGYSSPYYAGLTHCLLAVGVIFLWRISEILLVSSLIVGMWLVPTLVQFQSLEIGPFFNNFFALVVAALIAIASNAGRYSAARREHTANSRLAEAYARLRELDHAKNQFFANVSHELKTPLTMVLAPLELLIDGELGHISEAQRSTFESMQKSGVKLLRLIGDMLDLSKLK